MKWRLGEVKRLVLRSHHWNINPDSRDQALKHSVILGSNLYPKCSADQGPFPWLLTLLQFKMCHRIMRRIEVPRYPSHIIDGFCTTPSLVGDWSVPCVSEGPKVEEMEKAGESQCYSPLHQDREPGSSSSSLLPSDIDLESFLIWSLCQDRVV